MDERRILGLLREARQQLELERQRRTAPIAIVGIGCRFPGGASSPEALWNLLRSGVDATSDIPADRWDVERFYDPDPDAVGKAYVKRGGFLERIDSFDAEFFGISPREATGMDPQQRLLLEVSWEALEDGGIPPEGLRGSATGVWVGLGLDDYARRSITSGDLSLIDPYSALGNTRSVAAGRIAYVLDLRGPAVQLDTSCSSSLVAVHQACQSLRLNEVNLALVGGVNLMSSPEATIALCKLRALSPDGRCKTFDAEADGYARGEGCGMLVLKRLADARADGNRIYAVIRGTAINHDGRSNGLTAPNGLAQEAVIRAALANAGLAPAAVDYVEAHGTGTLLGDPIEIHALSRVYGEGRAPEDPLYVGSLKTNFGHLEGAAGVAGLIKLALCLDRGQITSHLNLQRHNPKIPWARLPIRVVTEAKEWPRIGKPRVGGVSSFGLSGTNAHVLLEEAPPLELSPAAKTRSAELIVLSAKTPRALEAAAGNLREYLDSHPQVALGDLAYSLLTTRSSMGQRLALSVPTRQALMEALHAAERGETPAAGARGQAGETRGKLAWLFTGQGAQQLGMGRSLHGEWPVFRDALDHALSIIDPLLDRPLRQVMWAAPQTADAALLDQTGYTQPALFAFEWALAQLWRSWGVEPDILLGHSIGEITAACVAGVFSLADAARLVCARARLMQSVAPGGAMVSIAADEATVSAAIANHTATVSVAAVNGSASTVIAGVESHVLEIAERFRADGVLTKRLVVSHAFHSPLMEPILELFRDVAQSIRYQLPRLPLVSNVTGAIGDSDIATAEYWVRHVRSPVLFSAGARALVAENVNAFIEIGPRSALLGLIQPSLSNEATLLLPSLRSAQKEPETLLKALATWVAHGGVVEPSGVFPSRGPRVSLPTYPWQRERHWIEALHTTLPLATRSRVAARDAGLYELVWRPVSSPANQQVSGTWLVLSSTKHRDGAEALSLELARRGASDSSVWHVALTEAPPVDNVITYWEVPDGIQGALDLITAALVQVQALARWPKAPRVWWVTRRALSVLPEDGVNAASSGLWGLARTVMQEHPELGCTLIDVDEGAEIVEAILAQLACPPDESQTAWRGGQRHVPRLVRLPQAQPATTRHWPPAQGTVLITGGLGGLGLLVARDLARRGAPRLVLVSRRGMATPHADAALEELTKLGAEVSVEAADVTDRQVLRRIIAAIPRHAPLRGVIHAVGVLDDGMLSTQTSARVLSVMAPKVAGAWNLHELTKDSNLDVFILFSSVAATLGSAGQGAYAAANAVLDGLAAQRRKDGLPALSIAWGPWAELGMTASLDERLRNRLTQSGFELMEPSQGLARFEASMQHSASLLVAASLNLEALAKTFAGSVPPVWRELVQAPTTLTQQRAWLGELATVPSRDRPLLISNLLRTEVARVLSRSDASALPEHQPLAELGLDSLMAAELRSALARRSGVQLTPSVLGSAPTLGTLAIELLRQASAKLAEAEHAAAPSAAPTRSEINARVAHCEPLSQLQNPRARLFCFPDAGGTPAMFSPLIELSRAGIEVHAISHTRGLAPGPASGRQYLDEAVEYLERFSDRPVALLGHSLGGLFAWRLSHELSIRGAPQPILVAVSAIATDALLDSVSDVQVELLLQALFGDNANTTESLRSDFKADMHLWNAVPRATAQTVPSPIAAFLGRRDQIVNEAAMRAWARHTTGEFSLTMLPGAHAYFSERAARDLLVTELLERLEAGLGRVL